MNDSIKDILLKSINVDTFVCGVEACVYDFKQDGFENYVIRKGKKFKPEHLDSHTCLTPVGAEYGNRNFGQPLLSAGGLTINIRQEGRSFFQIQELHSGYNREFNTTDKCIEVLEQMLKLPDSAYNKLIKDLKFLTAIGKDLDTIGDNVMFDANKGFFIVDLIEKDKSMTHTKNTIFSIADIIAGNLIPNGHNYMVDHERMGIVQKMFSRVHDRMYKAAKEEGFGISEAFNSTEIDSLKPKTSIIKIKAIPLARTPQELKNHLDYICNTYGLELGR